jgi:hypothetical protein
VGHFSKGCKNPRLEEDNNEAPEVNYPTADEPVTESFAQPQVMGAWGAAELVVADPIDAWVAGVVSGAAGSGDGW